MDNQEAKMELPLWTLAVTGTVHEEKMNITIIDLSRIEREQYVTTLALVNKLEKLLATLEYIRTTLSSEYKRVASWDRFQGKTTKRDKEYLGRAPNRVNEQ